MANLRANISGEEHDIDNWEKARKLQTARYIVSKFLKLGSTNG